MKIVLCGTMSLIAEEMLNIKIRLEQNGHQILLPEGIEKYFICKDQKTISFKVAGQLIKNHFAKIKSADAVLVINTAEKNGISNYIGGNTFQEMSFAFVLGKKIFTLNPLPDTVYADELKAMDPHIMHGDLSRINS